MTLSRINKRKRRSRATVFERVMAAIALANLIIVLFDLSYIRFRDLYLRFLPAPTIQYGETFKGIEPERTTVAYLALVDTLKGQQVDSGDTADRLTQQRILAQLVEQSTTIINEDPFAIAGKSGTLARIKNLMRDRMQKESSKAAFTEFWSEANFQGDTAQKRLSFFDSEIRPLIETNYYRGIGESGSPIDLFWHIDIGFMALFAAEFLTRTYVLSRRHAGTTWSDAMLWRIYDVPLFIGFWRWLRIVPVVLRLHQAHWLNLEPARNRLSRALVSQFAVELTEIVLLRTIDQVQKLVREGDVSRLIATATDRSKYVDINGVDEVQTIAKRLANVVVYQVLPKIKPDLDALLQHSVVGALRQAPAYQGLQLMPGFSNLSAQISQQVVAELSKTLTQGLQNAFADEQGAALTSQLITSFTDSLGQEMQRADTVDEVRGLVDDLLEEIKLNYVEGIATEDIAQLEASRYRLYGTTRRRSQ